MKTLKREVALTMRVHKFNRRLRLCHCKQSTMQLPLFELVERLERMQIKSLTEEGGVGHDMIQAH